MSNPTIGNVTPGSITTSLAEGQSETHTVSLTLPAAGSLSNMIDVFLLFDDGQGLAERVLAEQFRT